jgi:hypothetical protein
MATRKAPRSVPDIPGPTPTPVRPPKPPKPPKPKPKVTKTPWRDDYDNSKTTVQMWQDSGAGGTYGRPAFKKVTTTAGYSRLTGKQTVKPSTSTTKYGYKAGSGKAPYSKGTPAKRRSTKTSVRGV